MSEQTNINNTNTNSNTNANIIEARQFLSHFRHPNWDSSRSLRRNAMHRLIFNEILRDYNVRDTNPLMNTVVNVDNALRQSFYETGAYKNVLSEKGEKQLKEIKYKKEEHGDNEYCSISYEDFEEGEMVTQLPCNHIFKTEPINRWLKEESNKCPICRKELESKEVRNIEEETTHEYDEENNNDYDEEEDTDDDMPDLIVDNDPSGNNISLNYHGEMSNENMTLNNMAVLRDFFNITRRLLPPRINTNMHRSNTTDTNIRRQSINFGSSLSASTFHNELNSDVQRAIMMSINEANMNHADMNDFSMNHAGRIYDESDEESDEESIEMHEMDEVD